MNIRSATLVLAVLGLGAVSIGLAQKPSDEHVPGRLLVQRANSASDAEVEQVIDTRRNILMTKSAEVRRPFSFTSFK